MKTGDKVSIYQAPIVSREGAPIHAWYPGEAGA